ncbi:MAG: hypothetical protein Q7V88_13570 [Actinomycetota bacterium]|nr:hypothetical protein [Actinomycetota bacterium]
MVSYHAPTQEQVREALRRIPTTQLRRAFFEGLKNPLWVEPLSAEGVFDSPPEPERTDDGLIRDIYWPEIDYLLRVARDVPQAVVDVLLRLQDSNNAWVRRGVFEIGATIPPDQAARLQPLIKAWLATGLGWRTDPRDLVSYAVNLLSGDEIKAGRWIANVIFRPSGVKGGVQPSHVLEDYWYEEELPRVVNVLGADGLQVVLPWLVAYERQSGHLTDQSDITYISRDSIRIRGDSHDGVEQALIDAVRDLTVAAAAVDVRTATTLLLNSKMLLARKIAMFGVGELLKETSDEETRDQLLVVAREILFDDASSDDSCRIDYAELARAVADATGEPLGQLTQFMEPGPRVDRDRLREWLRGDASDDDDLEVRVREYVDHWKHRWLSAIGTDALPQPLRDELKALDARFGVIEGPLRPSPRITSWVGPTSPLRQDDMAAMTPSELVSHLESWHDTGKGWGPDPSHEGQGRELSALLTTNPKAISGVVDLVHRLRPTYLRAVLQGWEAALKADLSLDWTQAAGLIADVLAHSDESSFPPEGDSFDDDPDLRSAKRAAVGLLEGLAKRRPEIAIPGAVMTQFAELLITSAADELAWEEYSAHTGDSGMDPLTMSLNWQWPVRLRGLFHLLSWGSGSSWYDAARSELEVELARDDVGGASGAVIGESVGRLLDAVPEWVIPRVPELFGAGHDLSIRQQIALTTATAVYRYHQGLYELLSPSMTAAINSGKPIVSGWRHSQSDPLQRIGEWAIEGIIRGHTRTDGQVAEAFFQTAPAEVRGAALGHIAWNFMHASAVDDAIRDRLALLWDQRVAHVRSDPRDEQELNGFTWFVQSHKFAVEWWLPRLKEALELCPGLGAERFMIGKDLAASADIDARGAFVALKLLLEVRDERGLTRFDLSRHATPMVLARAIASGDDALKDEAVAYMNQLGEMGNVTLESEVNNVLSGAVTQADVDE